MNPAQLVFLTGQSDPRRCGLSGAQQAFGERLAAALGCVLHPYNFPWFTELLPGPPTQAAMAARPGLLRASWHNTRQYLDSGRSSFAGRWSGAWQRLSGQTERTWLLAGSCGLALLAGLRLPLAALAATRIFAYGPVTRWLPPVPTLLVQGRHDRWSRWAVPHADVQVDGGHLDYLAQPALLALARDWFTTRFAST
jgi:hypothetical protein